MPPWSVPPGLMVPGPRQPDAGTPPSASASGPAASESAAGDGSWPGAAPPAGWFLRARQPRRPAPSEDAPASPAPPAIATGETPARAGSATADEPLTAPESRTATAPEPDAPQTPAAPAGPWPNARPVPSPVREPDGSWSSPLTPRPALRLLGPTQARHGHAGGPGFQQARPGFQSARPGQPGTRDAGTQGGRGSRDQSLSPWQRSHQLWSEAGIQWEQPAAPQVPHTRSPASPPPVPRPRGTAAHEAPPLRPPASPWHVPGPHTRPGPPERQALQERQAPQERPAPQERQAFHERPAPLGAPVFSGPGVDEDGDPFREDRWNDDRPFREDRWNDDRPAREDRWDDDRPPIRERPPDLFPPPGPRQPPADETLLDHRMTGPRRSGSGRRIARIVVPVIVVVAVAVLALGLLTGHGPKFGPLSSDQHKAAPRTVAPRLPLAAVTFDAYPGQQQRGVFQAVSRVVAAGHTIVATGWRTSDGVVRQQFLVSTDAGASWHVAPVQAPGGGQGLQAALGHPATLLAGGPGGWVAVGPQAIWTSPTGLTWTLAATHGISPQLPGDSVWVIAKTAGGFLAAGTAVSPGTRAGSAARKATQAVIWTSRDGMTWRRGTAAQLGLAAPGESVLNISYATRRGNAIVISGNVVKNGASYDGAWLSTSNGAAWTRVAIPADHGAGPAISGLAYDSSGFVAVRPGRTAAGTPAGVAYFSPDGHDWQYAATIDPDPKAGGWAPAVVKGSDYGFVVTGTSAAGQLVASTSTGNGTD